jgi:hypothetical protein
MNRTASVMVMHGRDRVSWFVIPASVLGAVFVISWCVVLLHDVLTGPPNSIFTAGLASIYAVMLVVGVSTVTGTFPFAVGFGTRRRDFVLGTLAMAVVACAAWAIVLGLLSLVETNVTKNWGVGMHFFHLPSSAMARPYASFAGRGLLMQRAAGQTHIT